MSPSSPRPFHIRQTLGFLVLRSQRLMSQKLEEVLGRIDLTVPQHVALQLLFEGLACGPSEIAKTLGYDTGSSTRLVDQLADKGLVVRTRDAVDRRLVTLALTPEGRATAIAAQAAATDFSQDLLAAFDPAEADAFKAYLTRLVTCLEEPADG